MERSDTITSQLLLKCRTGQGIKRMIVTTLVAFIYLLISAVSGQECRNAVGIQHGLDRATLPAPVDATFLLAGYKIPCSGTVVAWEFCYQITGTPTAKFNPGIWRILSETTNVTYYRLVQTNEITYDPRGSGNDFPCSRFDIPESEQFTAPAGSVVGVYSGTGVQLLRTNTDNSIATYKFTRNHTRVNNTGDVNYNIEIKVHIANITTVTPGPTTTSTISTSVTTTVTHDTTSFVPTIVVTTALVSSSNEDIMIPVTSITTVLDETTPNNGDGSSDSSAAIIGGAVGGVILVLMITAVLCIVILCMKRPGRKAKGGTPMLNKKLTTGSNQPYSYNATNRSTEPVAFLVNQQLADQMDINPSEEESGTASTNSDTNEQLPLQNDATQEYPHAHHQDVAANVAAINENHSIQAIHPLGYANRDEREEHYQPKNDDPSL